MVLFYITIKNKGREMKKLLIIVLLSTFGMSETVSVTKAKSIEVCQSYITQAQEFKKTMGEDEISKSTLLFYKEKMLVHCGKISSKPKFEKISFLEMMAKSSEHTTAECKMAINMASQYSKNKTQSEIIVAAHRENIADNCGALVASHVSSYCLHNDTK